jgi:superfamily II DNA/RNA helicase
LGGTGMLLFSTTIFTLSHAVTCLSHLQVDCPGSIDDYIHRVGRTARYNKKGKSLMFLCPEEEAMLETLTATKSKIPIHIRKVSCNIFSFLMLNWLWVIYAGTG